MSKKPKKEPAPTVALDPKPKGEFKLLGGSEADDWNQRLANLVAAALPGQSSRDAAMKANKAVLGAMVDMAPADPIEGILMAQLMAATEASLCMYRRAWSQPAEYFEARTKYLQLADKAARTVMMLTERLDHHRGRGQQQITVKQVTTNNVTADQAIIADRVTTGVGAPRSVAAPSLLAANSETPMPVLSGTEQPDLVGMGGVEKKK
jgi:hypothetical protein